MYICICRGVTEKDIQNAVKQGICSMESLSESMGVSTQCGCCTTHACKALEEAKKEGNYCQNNLSA
jgi:bacterioferritin-associated ferredoxin